MADNKHADLVTKLDRNFLECGICLDRFRQPRGLPCLHSFCHLCLQKYCKGQKQILCPNCKKITTLPKAGVAGLPVHFMVNSLQDTLDMEKLKIGPPAEHQKRWIEKGRIDTVEYRPLGIAVHQNGDIVITTHLELQHRGVQIYSKNGVMKYSFQWLFDRINLYDIAITSGNRYILPGKAQLRFYDDQGKRLIYPDAATYTINSDAEDPRTMTVDSRGRIIVGLWHNTISIHHADGHLISKFAAPDQPQGLAVTSKGEIAATFPDNTLQLMDYSGSNVRVVQPPPGISSWEPAAVCCSKQGEIFVVNRSDPTDVFCYTADGDVCLGCIITGLDDPYGIAITEDGQQLYVTEYSQRSVKIFYRN